MVNNKKQEMDLVFHALADGTRRKILEMVSRQERCASELVALFQISFPAVSKHLKVLESAGFLERKVEGRVHRFRLKGETMKQAYDWIQDYTKFWNANLDQLDAYLEEEKRSKQ